MIEAERVAECLATTALAGAALTEVPLPDGAATTYVVDLPAGDLLPIWAQARDALAGPELYPVAVAQWSSQDWVTEDLFSRFYYGDDSAPETVIARSRTLSVEDALSHFARPDSWAAEHWEDVVEGQLDLTRHFYGTAPDPSAVAGVARGDELALERRLMDWEEALHPADGPESSESFGWFLPDDRAGLALLPLADPCHVAAYLAFYGAQGSGGHEALTRLMCSWQQRFGARPVASWGTMLQFVASSPPATLEDAFQLAAEHIRVAPCTTLLPGEGARHLARHLWRGERWFLHERP